MLFEFISFHCSDKAESVLEEAQKEFDYCQKKLNYEEAIVNQLRSVRNGLEMANKIHLANNLQQGIPNS